MDFNRTVLATGSTCAGLAAIGAYATVSAPWYLAPLAVLTTVVAARALYHVGAAAHEVNSSAQGRVGDVTDALVGVVHRSGPDLGRRERFFAALDRRLEEDYDRMLSIQNQILDYPALASSARRFYARLFG